MNEFLRTREQINQSTKWLQENNLTCSGLDCKNWELAEATKELIAGDILDMGCDGSYVLHNAVQLGLSGRKAGIDLLEVSEANRAQGVEYFKGDLMKTSFEDESFDLIFSLSVLEHSVNINNFAEECGRLLSTGGKLIVSFDYSNPKPDTSLTKLYALDWNILDQLDVAILISVLKYYGLEMEGELDWSTQDAVINPSYCSPAPVSYTFGILKFIKK